MSETKSGLSKPSRFANYSKHSSQQIFSFRCRHCVSIDLKTYLLNSGNHCRPRKQRAWQPITWPRMFPIYRAIIFHLSRDILILSRDKKNVACPLWATVEDITKITRQNQRNNSKQITRHKTNYQTNEKLQNIFSLSHARDKTKKIISLPLFLYRAQNLTCLTNKKKCQFEDRVEQ